MVNHVRLKVVYVTLYPEKYPRVRKIAVSLKDEDVAFQALTPRIRVKLGSRQVERIISAIITYASYLLQIFFTQADVYWVANSPDIFVIPLIARKANYILDYRSPWPLEVELEFGRGTLSRLAKYLTSIAIGNAKVVTVPSGTLKKDVQRYDKKVYVIPNYPLKDDFKSSVSRAQFRKQNGVTDGQKVVLFTGRLAKVEGFDILARIVEEIVDKREDVVFWIVGDGVLSPLAQDLASKFPRNVKYLGWQQYREIPDFVSAADVCIVPRHKTPFSNYYNEEGVQKIAEYMLFRKPIVASGIAPSKEYLLVEPEDMVDGILLAAEGKVPKPTPRTWEDYCEGKVLEVLNFVKKLRGSC